MRQYPERCSVPGCHSLKAAGLEKCRHHAARDRATQRKLYAFAKSVRACTKCIGRKGTTPAVPGRTRCAECLERDREAKTSEARGMNEAPKLRAARACTFHLGPPGEPCRRCGFSLAAHYDQDGAPADELLLSEARP